MTLPDCFDADLKKEMNRRKSEREKEIKRGVYNNSVKIATRTCYRIGCENKLMGESLFCDPCFRQREDQLNRKAPF